MCRGGAKREGGQKRGHIKDRSVGVERLNGFETFFGINCYYYFVDW